METTRRKPGEGTVRELPSGRFQPGLTLANGRRQWSKVTYSTREEAEQALLALRAVVADQPRGGATFAAYGRLVLDRVERRKLYAPKTIDTYRNRFGVSLEGALFSDAPLRSISQRQIASHMDSLDRDLARSTAVVALAVVRLIFSHAVRDGLVDDDPSKGYRFPRRRRIEADEPDDTRSFFTPEQFDALLGAATPMERCMMRIAITTGLRLGEMITLHLRDVHTDGERPHLDVRYGGRHGGQLQPTKGKKRRRVYLTGPALEAVREWTEAHLPAFRRNDAGLMFPTVRGEFRTSRRFLVGKHKGVERWPTLIAAAGLADVRPALVWHSFRHTAATWLLSGLWGHKWTPDEVQQHLGHESLQTTLIYARVVDERLAETAARTGTDEDHGMRLARKLSGQSSIGAKKCCFSDISEWNRAVRPKIDQAVIDVSRGSMDGAQELAALWLAHPGVRLAMEVLAGGPFAANRALDLARLTTDADDAQRPTRAAEGT